MRGAGVDGVGARKDFEFYSSSGERWGSAEDIINDDVLVTRARKAFGEAEKRGDGLVEMEEREWAAWQRNEAIEAEIERRVAERLEAEIRRRKKVVVPATSQHSLRAAAAGASPGFMTGDGFAPLGGPSRIAPRILPNTTNVRQAYQNPTPNIYLEKTSPMSPSPSPAGAFPESPEPLPRPSRTGARHVSPMAFYPSSNQLPSSSSLFQAYSQEHEPSGAVSYPGKRYYHASKSETDIQNPESDDNDDESIHSTQTSSLTEAHARRTKREELRRTLNYS